MIYEDQEVGAGYCLGIQCHFEIIIEGTPIEETMTFLQDKLYRAGSYSVEGETAAHEESLIKTAD